MVRLKNRYLLLEVMIADGSGVPSDSEIYRALIRNLHELHGDYGLGFLKFSLKVKVLNAETGILCLRCSREGYNMLAGVIPFLGSIGKQQGCLRTIHVGASMRSCERALLKDHKTKLLCALPTAQTLGRWDCNSPQILIQSSNEKLINCLNDDGISSDTLNNLITMEGGEVDGGEGESPIICVFVVGFHHKKGCQVEYCYPPLNGKDSHVTDEELPGPWIHIPSLALPDGAHNVEKDTIYFLLPSLKNPKKSVYAVSCYRQMNANDLMEKTSEVTRSSVQKSVTVISRLPLFGLLKAKLELITQAYFNERDFAKVEVLADMYRNLQSTVTKDLLQGQALLDIPVRDHMLMSRHKMLILFKLVLLEKRVLFHMFPVQKLCLTILSLLSLFPRMIEHGLAEAASYIPSIPRDTDDPCCHNDSSDPMPRDSQPTVETKASSETQKEPDLIAEIEQALEGPRISEGDSAPHPHSLDLSDSNEQGPGRDLADLPSPSQRFFSASAERIGKLGSRLSDYYWSSFSLDGKENVVEIGTEAGEVSNWDEGLVQPKVPSTLNTDSWGMPLSIFTKGSLCHPYLSLPFLDTLSAPSSRSYLFGATNALYPQRKDLWDAMSDESGELVISIQHSDLKKQLALTTADLRFCDYLIKAIIPDTGNIFIDATGWEGGDEWIRLQFRAYLLSLIATGRSPDPNLREDFNESFLQAWKTTHNYRVLYSGGDKDLVNAVPGHPFAGQFNVADVKVRLNNALASQQGKRISSAVSQTGKYVSQTGKNVKSMFNSWWTEGGSKPK